MVGATVGEAGLPMTIGLLMQAFGPRSLPWTILMCAAAQVILYFSIHVVANHPSSHEVQHEKTSHLMDSDTEEYSKISLDTDDESNESEIEMTTL